MARSPRACFLLPAAALWHCAAFSLEPRAQNGTTRAANQSKFCAPVIDAGAMGLVEVEVGSPSGAKLSLVIDTGSNVLIVESCECQDAAVCPQSEHCYSNKTSRTYTPMMLPNGTGRNLLLSFGSGLIGGRVAKEKVKVGTGGVVDMQDGLLLMTSRELDFAEDFEGIFGLGPPSRLLEKAKDSALAEARDQLRKAEKYLSNATEEQRQAYDAARQQVKEEEEEVQPLGFLEQAGIHRFSLCFGKGTDTNGTFVAGGPAAATPLKSVGTLHWGLSIEGISVGGKPVMYTEPEVDWNAAVAQAWGEINARTESYHNVSTLSNVTAVSTIRKTIDAANVFRDIRRKREHPPPQQQQQQHHHQQQPQQQAQQHHAKVREPPLSPPKAKGPKALCTRGSMAEGQETPCGAVPDSGTTALAMPQAHLDAVAEAICDSWGRCRANHTALLRAKVEAEKAAAKIYGINPFDLPNFTKAEVLSFMLMDCARFEGQDVADVMADLPDIQVEISDGTPTRTKLLSIPAASYIFQQNLTEEPGDALPNPDADVVCLLGLQKLEYETEKNGAVWILGKPLFHEYTVMYDLQANTIGFQSTDEEPCGLCQPSDQLGLLSSDASVSARSELARRAPLKAPKRFRSPRVDTSKPL